MEKSTRVLLAGETRAARLYEHLRSDASESIEQLPSNPPDMRETLERSELVELRVTRARRTVCGSVISTSRTAVRAAGSFNPSPLQVNEPSFDLGEKIRRSWANIFRLDCTALGQPIGLVTRQNSWETFLGQPMQQTVPDTCALVACTVAVEAKHRLEYEMVHGEGTFPCRAAASCDLLIQACLDAGIWAAGKGANVGKVLTKIQQMGGVPAAPCVLPLRSWQRHRWDAADSAARLSPERVAELLDTHGPCVGVLWVEPPYFDVDAGRDDTVVYRGCDRNDDYRKQSKERYGDEAGSHAVVCFAYRRFRGEQMHLQVRDNHDARANGPQRWVDVEELDTLYTLRVERLDDRPLPVVVPVRRSRRAIRRPNPRVSGPEWTQ